MALWKEQTGKEGTTRDNFGRDVLGKEPDATFDSVIEKSSLEKITPAVPAIEPIRRSGASSSAKESIIASDLIIEGKIEGTGHVRIAGKFKGDVNVQGNLTIDSGAQLTGGVRADAVIVGGELSGNIEAASRVELLQTGILNGDLKAGSLTVAAGSRMRGRVEFGWGDIPAAAELADKRAAR
ncbi:MAG TPA: polymer-forming cytoskeletal protein [Steroidobacteraceae bacterium]|nr:polymer-forming cytoskeletal protein [Steroidobacteraceae bacterium]